MTKQMTVADYLSRAIDLSGKTQIEIAQEVGYTRANVVSMMKLGVTKIPINKVPDFAKALGLDPTNLMRLCLREYLPEVWETIRNTLGEPLTDKEKKVLEIYREADPGGEKPMDTMRIIKLKDAFAS